VLGRKHYGRCKEDFGRTCKVRRRGKRRRPGSRRKKAGVGGLRTTGSLRRRSSPKKKEKGRRASTSPAKILVDQSWGADSIRIIAGGGKRGACFIVPEERSQIRCTEYKLRHNWASTLPLRLCILRSKGTASSRFEGGREGCPPSRCWPKALGCRTGLTFNINELRGKKRGKGRAIIPRSAEREKRI